MERITATEASRNFRRLLDRVGREGESFLVERNGEPVVEIRPAAPAKTMAGFLDALASATPDDGFADDMEAIRAASRSEHGRDRWGVG